MSYLIDVNTGEMLAYTTKKLKSGERVQLSGNRCKESLNANREWGLVNAVECKVSNAKKWDKEIYPDVCIELNDNEFYI